MWQALLASQIKKEELQRELDEVEESRDRAADQKATSTVLQENLELCTVNTQQAATIRLLERRVGALEAELRSVTVTGQLDEGQQQLSLVEQEMRELEATKTFFVENGIETDAVEADLALLAAQLSAMKRDAAQHAVERKAIGKVTGISELLEISRNTAQNALVAAAGDVNLAISNLLTNVIDPAKPPLLLLATDPNANATGGVTHSDARRLLEGAGGDIDEAMITLRDSIADAAATEEQPLAEQAKAAGVPAAAINGCF